MRRVLLNDDATPEALESLFDGLGWPSVPDGEPLGPAVAERRLWAAPAGGAGASYQDLASLDCCFVAVTDNAFDQVSRALGAAGLSLPREVVLNPSLDDAGAARRSIGRLGLLAHGPFDPEIFSRLSAVIVRGQPPLLRLALFALGYTAWPEFEPVLRSALDRAVFPPDLAPAAQALLEALRTSHWNEALYRDPAP